MAAPLAPGDELHCPHCRAWHPLIVRHQAGTDYTTRMLYWECGNRMFYAGQIDGTSRYPTRRG